MTTLPMRRCRRCFFVAALAARRRAPLDSSQTARLSPLHCGFIGFSLFSVRTARICRLRSSPFPLLLGLLRWLAKLWRSTLACDSSLIRQRSNLAAGLAASSAFTSLTERGCWFGHQPVSHRRQQRMCRAVGLAVATLVASSDFMLAKPRSSRRACKMLPLRLRQEWYSLHVAVPPSDLLIPASGL